MRTLLKLAAAALLSFLAISPLSAQNATSIAADTNQTANSSEALQKQKLEQDKELAEKRIEAEEKIVKSRDETHRQIVHDLAWNSWVLFVIAIFFFGSLRDKRRHETIRLMIEKGAPITPDILDGLRRKAGRTAYDPHGYLRWGLTETLVALALMIAFPSGGGRAAGWIVLAVGLANSILWFIGRAHPNGGQSR